MSEVIRWR